MNAGQYTFIKSLKKSANCKNNLLILRKSCGHLGRAKDFRMNLDKAKKRIAKQVKKGFNGYPQVALEYFGQTTDVATEVVISFILEEGAEPQEQKFVSKTNVREDEAIQSIMLKIIERAEANTVSEVEGTSKL